MTIQQQKNLGHLGLKAEARVRKKAQFNKNNFFVLSLKARVGKKCIEKLV